MQAEGTSPNADAWHVLANCLLTKDIGMLELSTRKVTYRFLSMGRGD